MGYYYDYWFYQFILKRDYALTVNDFEILLLVQDLERLQLFHADRWGSVPKHSPRSYLWLE